MTDNTDLKFLDDTYLDEAEGVVMRVGKDERGPFLVLDQTIFYPQGGGQPSDTGSIRSGDSTMNVSFVGFVDGEVLHYLAEEPPPAEALVGRGCALSVDRSRRLQNARVHTAGHLIAGIVDARRGPLRSVKGFHFSQGPYVEFEGTSDEATSTLLAALQAEVDAFIEGGAPVVAELVSYEELERRCWTVPSYLPRDKPLRTVTIAGLDAVPCGGTHVASTAELGAVSLVKLKRRKGNTKISYRVS